MGIEDITKAAAFLRQKFVLVTYISSIPILLHLETLLADSTDPCDHWFTKSLIKPEDPKCELKCATHPVDMGTFTCGQRCYQYCKRTVVERFLFNLTDLYPTLTDEERVLASKEPKTMTSAYMSSLKAEKICLDIYKSSNTNDESDACRHFIWAALLFEKFGSEKASDILNAHEADPLQPIQEKSMDLANNRLGLLIADHLIKKKIFSTERLQKEFVILLEKNNFIVLKPKRIKK